MWLSWVDDKDRIVMQFLADITKLMIDEGYLSFNDLYNFSEDEVVNMIRNCENSTIRNAFNNFEKCNVVINGKVDDKYCIMMKTKVRYINPYILNEGWISEINLLIKELMNNYLKYKKSGFVGLDFKI